MHIVLVLCVYLFAGSCICHAKPGASLMRLSPHILQGLITSQQKNVAGRNLSLLTVNMVSEKLRQLKLQPVQGFSASGESKQKHDGVIIGSYSDTRPKNLIRPRDKATIYTGIFHRKPESRRPEQVLFVEDPSLYVKIRQQSISHYPLQPDNPNRVALHYIRPSTVRTFCGIDRAPFWVVNQSIPDMKFEDTVSFQRHGYAYEEEPENEETLHGSYTGCIYHVSRWGWLWGDKRVCTVYSQNFRTREVKEDVEVGRKESVGGGLASSIQAGFTTFIAGFDETIYEKKTFNLHHRDSNILLSEEGSQFAEDAALSKAIVRIHWVLDRSLLGSIYRIRKMEVHAEDGKALYVSEKDLVE